jgi:hypothetical protein
MYGMLLFLASCGGGSPDMQNVIPPVQNDNGGCMSANALLLGSGGTPFIAVDAADFDGTNDYMSRGAALTGLSSGKSGIVSLWFRIDGGDGINLAFLTGDANPSSFPFFYQRWAR